MARLPIGVVLKSSALGAACLALVVAAGCQRGEPSQPKVPASPKAQAGAGQEPSQPDAKPEAEKPKAEEKLTGREVLERMAAAYHKASSYADMGTAHLLAEADGQKIDEESTKFVVAFVRPNKIHLQAYAAELVCDGKKLYAYAKNVPDQVLVRPAPPRLTMKNVLPDRVVAVDMNRGFAGGLPQLADSLGRGSARRACCTTLKSRS